MKIALLILCICAVAFLLRVLAALVMEGMRVPPGGVTVHFAKFNPSRRSRQLIVMNPEAEQPRFTAGTHSRIAL